MKRILCLEVSGKCLDLRVRRDPFNGKEYFWCAEDIAKDWKDISKDTCKNCKTARYLGITRKQAIEKMAKALEENLNGSSFNSLAEAALNSLLEGHDDEQ